MRTTHNYLFLSDLHLSEGVNPHTGKLDRNEDFFYDLEFAQLLVYHVNEWKKAKGDDPMARPWKLCINGDIWDFLQVVSLPPDDHPIFTKYGVELTDNKREYGLGTSEPETMWKLRRIAEGHPIFFQALGWFLSHEGFEVILLKGNHDTELYWQGVQEVTRHVIGEQYATWYKKMYEGALPDSPFAFRTNMPPKLEHLAQRIQFPPWFYYEPGLFYAEHGNQYDAANAYRNFLHPTVPDRPDLIELPSGSFFVRYFFNKIEILHPFADNLRPLTRYVNWALNSEPLDTLQLVFRNPRTLWKFFTSFTAKQVRQATRKPVTQPAGKDDKMPLPLEEERRTALHALHERYQAEGQRNSRQSLWQTALGVVARTLAMVMALLGIRFFVVASYGFFVVAAVAVLICYFIAAYLSRKLNDVENYVSLWNVSQEVQQVLNSEVAGQRAAVPFHIFGHDHYATFEELHDPHNPQPPFRQWYVNTGSWLPSFSETDRLTRGDLQLAFLRLVPGLPNFSQNLPELLEWLPDANRPRPIRMLKHVE